MPENEPLSVVIATLGESSLEKTLEHLQNCDYAPSEIIIAIPVDYAHNVTSYADDTVRVLQTEVRGQVAQRSEGLKSALYPIVMQVDDDIEFDFTSTARLYNELITLGPKTAVGPALYGKDDRQPLSPFPQGISGIMHSAFGTILAGMPWGTRRMGRYHPVTARTSVDPAKIGTTPFPVDWLPGGCVMTRREDAVMADYFPVTGKAYGEDLIQSHLRRKAGIAQYVISEARAYIERNDNRELVAAIESEMATRRSVALTMGASDLHTEFFLRVEKIIRKRYQ